MLTALISCGGKPFGTKLFFHASGSLPFEFMLNHLHGHRVQSQLKAIEELTTPSDFTTFSTREDSFALAIMDHQEYLTKYNDLLK